MIGVGLDLAERTGWAVGRKGTFPLAGVWDTRGFSDRERAKTSASVYSAVFQLVRENKAEIVGIEAPLSLQGRSAHTQRSLTMLSGAAQAGAINGGAKIVLLVAPQTWREAVLGNGYPRNPKQAALDYCKMFKWGITDHNAADAACVLTWALS